MGSVLFLASWAVLMGPIQYAQHLLSGPRLPFTAAYFTSIGLTLFFAIKVSRPSFCASPGRPPSVPNRLLLTLDVWFAMMFDSGLLTMFSHDSFTVPF